MEFRHKDILAKLPHRYPFLLVDRVLKYTPGPSKSSRVGRKILAIKNVTFNEPFFQGHFPDNPVMPGVLQVEAMAQAGAVACVPDPGESMDVMIAKIENAKFKQPVVPGDQLLINAEITLEKSSILGLTCQITVDDKVVAQASMMAKIFPLKNKSKNDSAHSSGDPA